MSIILQIFKRIKYFVRDFIFLLLNKILLKRSIEYSLNLDLLKNVNFVVLAIAFNNFEYIKLQYNFLNKNFINDFIYLVVDNSTDVVISEKLANFCKKNNVPYFKIKNFGLHKLNPSLSHGFALNCVIENVILPSNTNFLGILDHDIFPFSRYKISLEDIRGKILGIKQERDGRIYLWPGFMFMDFSYFKKYKFNFMPWKSLDTGGSNFKTFLSDNEEFKRVGFFTETPFIVDIDYGSLDLSIIENKWVHLRSWKRAILIDINQIVEYIKKNFDKI